VGKLKKPFINLAGWNIYFILQTSAARQWSGLGGRSSMAVLTISSLWPLRGHINSILLLLMTLSMLVQISWWVGRRASIYGEIPLFIAKAEFFFRSELLSVRRNYPHLIECEYFLSYSSEPDISQFFELN
jgi:hypothetical protein